MARKVRAAWALGVGGLIDGIVLHQILQWHHMISDTEGNPVDTLEGLEANTLADGLFHGATWMITFVGVWMLWEQGQASYVVALDVE